MPDGDRFERKLHGKYWRKALHLARGDAPVSFIVDSLMQATANGLRTDLLCPSLLQIFDATYEALTLQNQRRQPCADANLRIFDPFQKLIQKLDTIEAANVDSPSTRLAALAAQTTYLDFESSRVPATVQQIQDSFIDRFIVRIVDFKWLSRVRDSIVEHTSRSYSAQIEWEEVLQEAMRSQGRRLGVQLFRPNTQVAVRAPRRLIKRRETTIEQLNQPLAVL